MRATASSPYSSGMIPFGRGGYIFFLTRANIFSGFLGTAFFLFVSFLTGFPVTFFSTLALTFFISFGAVLFMIFFFFISAPAFTAFVFTGVFSAVIFVFLATFWDAFFTPLFPSDFFSLMSSPFQGYILPESIPKLLTFNIRFQFRNGGLLYFVGRFFGLVITK